MSDTSSAGPSTSHTTPVLGGQFPRGVLELGTISPHCRSLAGHSPQIPPEYAFRTNESFWGTETPLTIAQCKCILQSNARSRIRRHAAGSSCRVWLCLSEPADTISLVAALQVMTGAQTRTGAGRPPRPSLRLSLPLRKATCPRSCEGGLQLFSTRSKGMRFPGMETSHHSSVPGWCCYLSGAADTRTCGTGHRAGCKHLERSPKLFQPGLLHDPSCGSGPQLPWAEHGQGWGRSISLPRLVAAESVPGLSPACCAMPRPAAQVVQYRLPAPGLQGRHKQPLRAAVGISSWLTPAPHGAWGGSCSVRGVGLPRATG